MVQVCGDVCHCATKVDKYGHMHGVLCQKLRCSIFVARSGECVKVCC